MKKIMFLSIALIALSTSVFAQKYFTRNGHIWFYSEAPLENIEAHNYQASSVLDTESGELVFSLLMKGFEFEKALMQEHFNEKYIHSDQYPKATFEGNLTNMDAVDLGKDGEYEVDVKGDLTIHGVTKPVQTRGTLKVSGGRISGKAKFPVTVADYNIEIPSVVKDNIAKVVDVYVDMDYQPYSK